MGIHGLLQGYLYFFIVTRFQAFQNCLSGTYQAMAPFANGLVTMLIINLLILFTKH
jgi:hypothetical protein